jgi:hypothetical protein
MNTSLSNPESPCAPDVAETASVDGVSHLRERLRADLEAIFSNHSAISVTVSVGGTSCSSLDGALGRLDHMNIDGLLQLREQLPQ